MKNIFSLERTGDESDTKGFSSRVGRRRGGGEFGLILRRGALYGNYFVFSLSGSYKSKYKLIDVKIFKSIVDYAFRARRH